MATLIRRFKFGFVAVATIGVALVAAPDAHATITGELTVANANLATQGSGPYASYTITLSGSTVTVTATGENGFVFGDSNVFDLNLNPLVTSISNFTSITGGINSPGSGNVDGFGTFSLTTDDGNGFSSPLTSLSFSFTINTSGTVTEANLLALNSKGADVAGHMALATNTACTGFAANGGTSSGSVDNSSCTGSSVPEPASIALLGTALIGLAFVGRVARTNPRS